MSQRSALVLGALFALGCATLAAPAGDEDAPRPNAGAGPFRTLRSNEMAIAGAPYAIVSKPAEYHQATFMDLGDGHRPSAAALYVVGKPGGNPGVYRFEASDGRSFAPNPTPTTPVLVASETWEGSTVDTPEIVRVGTDFLLLYSAAGGIGAARSSDGIVFQKLPGPLLGTSGAPAWEGGDAPKAPTLVALTGGEFRLFYEANGRIGEARSSDGVSFERIGTEPVLSPDAGSGGETPFDSLGVGDPEAHTATSAEGRALTRVYYTGRSSDGSSAIGLAARFGNSGPLTRALAPAFTSTRVPYAPDVVVFGDLELLFVTQKKGISTSEDYPAIALGIAPATVSIPVK